MPALLAPLGLVVVTSAARDALTATDGQLIWNSDNRQVERYGDLKWSALAVDEDVMELIGALALSIGQIQSALRFLDVEPTLFDPDMQ